MLQATSLLRRAPQKGALFAFCLLCLQPGSVWAGECLPFQADEWVEIAHVYDGDTVKLKDGRKLRLIGINTPEIGHDGEPSEPLAEQARQALKIIFESDRRLALHYGSDKKDRYGRLLAHAFLPDKRNVQELLLQRGLAIAVVVAPNLANLDCYLAAEKRAGQQGIWSLARYQGIETSELLRGVTGFQVIRGKVIRVGESRKAYWLNFAGKVAARIDKRHLSNFEGRTNIPQLEGKTVKLRGWLYRHKDERQMRIDHPAALEVM